MSSGAIPKAFDCGKKSLPATLALAERFPPLGLSPFGLEEPPSHFLERDRLPAMALAVAEAFLFGLHLQALGKHFASESVTDLGSYKKVAGVYFPFSMELGNKRQDPADFAKVTLDSIEANVALDPAQFKMPALKPAPAAAPEKEF